VEAPASLLACRKLELSSGITKLELGNEQSFKADRQMVNSKHGLFVGLATLDLIYLTEALPTQNQKIVALDYTVAAGGPATNAAVAFGYLGDRPTLLSIFGTHPINQLVLAELEEWGVAIADLNPQQTAPLPTSSIIVTQTTGERAVVSLNAVRLQASLEQMEQALGDRIPSDTLSGVDIVLIDGHQMAVGREIAQRARANQISVVIDGGSWKPGFEKVLSLADYVICSSNFHPPGCSTAKEVLAYLTDLGISHIAITQGEKPIQTFSESGISLIPVPQIRPVDTLGAGDIFHGAFCHYILRLGFEQAIAASARIAAKACESFGTRIWMKAKLD
jgi:sugar/nucleoside kinase (ribokinase family)